MSRHHTHDEQADQPTEALHIRPSGTPPQPPAPRRRRRWPWVVGVAAGIVIIATAVANSGNHAPAPAPAAGTPAPATAAPAQRDNAAVAGAGTVTYEVTGSGRAGSISYGDAAHGISQSNGSHLPWIKTAPADDGFGVYSLSAQSTGSGSISCRITVDGQQIAHNTSDGQYAVVSCSGTH